MRILQKRFCDVPALDFGKHILPKILSEYRTFAYDFASQKLPGAKPYEEQGYWRDVGNIESFWQTHMDLLGAKPKMDLNNPLWPISTSLFHLPPSKFLGGHVENSMISNGCVIHPNAIVKNCVLGSSIIVGEGCVLEDSIVMDSCEFKKGSKIKKTIVDRFNIVPEKQSVGHIRSEDAQRYYIDPSGIVVIPRGRKKFI